MKGLLYSLMLAGSTFAGTVTLTSVGGSQFVSHNGNALPAGCSVRIGTFNLPAATVATTRDYKLLLNAFKPLAEGTVGGGTAQQVGSSGSTLRTNNFPAAGQVFGQISGISDSYVVPGTQLYAWVFDAATPEAAQQWGIFTAGTWTAPPGLGAQSLSTAAAVQAVQGSASATQLKLNAIPASYGNWAWKKFGLAAAGAVTDFNADSDGDGLKNLVEYAWGTNPGNHDNAQTGLTAAGSSAVFTFKNPLHQPDVSVTAECSTDLKTWTAVTSTVVSSDAEFETRAVSAPPGTKCFWRVKFNSVTAP